MGAWVRVDTDSLLLRKMGVVSLGPHHERLSTWCTLLCYRNKPFACSCSSAVDLVSVILLGLISKTAKIDKPWYRISIYLLINLFYFLTYFYWGWYILFVFVYYYFLIKQLLCVPPLSWFGQQHPFL